MEMSSEDAIKKWHEKLVLTGRSQEAALILSLAFTRPRLLYQVMDEAEEGDCNRGASAGYFGGRAARHSRP